MAFSILQTTWQGILFSIGAVIVINVIHTLLTAIYNLYFHPLSKLPGPKLWIAFPILKNLNQLDGHLEEKIVKLHEKYGEVVRSAPDDVTFTSAQAWKDIYGHGHAELPKYFPKGLGFDTEPQIISANSADHFRFRRAMLPAFSEKALGQQENIIKSYVDLLIVRLGEVAESGAPTDMVKWYNFTTFDLIGDLAYGESLNGLKECKENEWISNIHRMMKLMPMLVLLTASPILAKIALFFASDAIKKSRENHLKKARDLTMKRINNKDQEHRGDFMDCIMRADGEKHGLTHVELARNSDTLLVAGSETTATLLSGATFYLAKYPETLRKCTAEVREAFSSEDEINFRSASSKLSYMLACLNEALRLYPPVGLALYRVTLPGTLTPVAGHMIPPNTKVGVHHLAAYHSEKNFHRAKEYVPERWLSEEYTSPSSPFHRDNRDVHKPFSFGPRDCIGRNLAFQEMRLILSRLLWNYDLSLCEESTEWSRQKINGLWDKPPLMIKLTKREL